ncbi:MAG: type VI secretion system baseplate subunit TssF [Planctomycetes bacterium]|nr:type VI secretion system baseplate subunit TssF [Planctomycetota bacterium]
MCGRIREKLDDELPEFTADLMSMLWPHYLRPIPSMTILELLPEMEGMQAPLSVPAKSQFASIPVDGTRCKFRSTWDVTIRPWMIREALLETAAAKPVRLVLRLDTAPKAGLEDLELGNVRFHLAGEPRTAFVLYLLLLGHLDHVTISDGSVRHDRREEVLPGSAVTPAGLNRADAVLEFPPHSFIGYRLIQEYFAFKDRFLFFDLRGLDRAVKRLELEHSVEIAFTFNRRLDSFPMVSRENVRLHCVPLVNLFSHPAEPIRMQNDRVNHLVQPSRSGLSDRRHAEVYSTDQVCGLRHSEQMESHEFLPFFSFSHQVPSGSGSTSATFYHTHRVANVVTGDPRQGTDTYISFVPNAAARSFPNDETISIELTCTNRELPSALRADDVREPTDSSPAGLSFRNIVKPTNTTPPPLGRELHWRLISHMSLNYTSLTDADRFRQLLRVYDFQSAHDAQAAMTQQRMLDGILSLKSGYRERMVRGAVIRGLQVDLELHEDHFAGEGDAFLFSQIVDRFLGLYVTLNSFAQLSVRFSRSGHKHTFPARWGDQATPAEAR